MSESRGAALYEVLKLGHVETRQNPAHRRSVLVALTRSGSAAMNRLHAQELRRLAVMAPDCTAHEIAAAVKVLGAHNRDVRQRAADLRHPRSDSR